MPHPITIDRIRGVFAVLATPSTSNASEPDPGFAVDLEETERATRALVTSGVSAIMTNGSLGEMATLSFEEWREYNRVVLETAHSIDADFPVFVGATALSTRETIRLAREVGALGGRGLFLGRPFWCPLDPGEILSFYSAVADALPDLAICIYDNPDAFKGPIPSTLYRELSHIPQVVASKYIALTPKFNQDMLAVGDRMRILPLDADWFTARMTWPDDTPGCWSSAAACGPEPLLHLARALDGGKIDEAREVARKIAHAVEPFMATRDWPEFVKYNIPLEKVRMDAAGFLKAGPARHPYQNAPQPYVDGSVESGRRWRRLREDFQ